MQRFFSFRQGILVVGALSAMTLASARAGTQGMEFRATGSFDIISVEDHVGHVNVTGASEPGGSFEGGLVERYWGNTHKIGNVHKIQGAGVFDYGGGHSLYFEYDVLYNEELNLDEGIFTITGGTGAFEGATGGGTLVADHALQGFFEMVGTIIW